MLNLYTALSWPTIIDLISLMFNLYTALSWATIIDLISPIFNLYTALSWTSIKDKLVHCSIYILHYLGLQAKIN